MPSVESGANALLAVKCCIEKIFRPSFLIEDLDRALRLLADNPRNGADCTHILPGLRRLVVGQHAAFYRVKDNYIRILRVLQKSMASAARLKNI